MTSSRFAPPRSTAAVVGSTGTGGSLNAVVLCCDARYAFFCRVTLHSILVNTAWRDFHVVVVTDGLDRADIDSLDQLGKLHAVAISVLTVPRTFVQQMPVSLHWTGAAYLRVAAPELVDASWLLYVDSDIIVQADIADLFALKRNAAACVAGVIDEKGGRMRKKALMLGLEEPYVNTGLLLIDVRQWRETSVFRRSMQFVEERGSEMLFVDQDVLNVVLRGCKHVLPEKWNMQTFTLGSHGLRQLGDVNAFAGVLHFSGRIKPWMRWADRWGQSLYLKYAEPLGLPLDFWREPETLGHKLLEARAADEADDVARANAIRQDVVRLLLRICGGQASARRLDEI